MLKYALYKINLPNAVDKFVAYTQVDTTATLDDLIDDMTSRGSTVTKAEVLSNWEELSIAIVNRLKRGQNISTSLFYISQDITGVLDGLDDTFKQGRNEVVFNFIAGAILKEAASKISVLKVEPTKLMPAIKDFTNFATQTHNALTLGNVARLTGINLKIDEKDPSQGVFLIAADNSETRIASFIDNIPSTLTFLIPSTLVAGNYRLEVRVKINGSKELRSIIHTELLAVA